MTTQEAAEMISADASTIRRMCRAGEIKAKKRGRDWWIEKDAMNTVSARNVGRPKKKTTTRHGTVSYANSGENI